MAAMVWMAGLALLALLVGAVNQAHQGLPDRKVPLVRKVPPGYQVRPGSRAHRVRRAPPGFTYKK
jgi:hypothetical protein